MRRLARFAFQVVLVVLMLAPAVARADSVQTDVPEKISLSSKVPVSFYGFILAEGLYSDSQLSSYGTLDNSPANYNRTIAGFNRVVDENVGGHNDGFVSATVQNTRFGFMLDPYDFNGKNFTVDARIEMDFYSTSNLSAGSVAPRLRRAYAGIGQKWWHVLFGQEWDVFSPLNPATMNIGANMWLQGNQGYRRPQIQLTLNQSLNEKSGFEEALSENLPSNSLASNDPGNTTGIPMTEGRVGYWYQLPAGKLWAYISGVYARHKNAIPGGSYINNWGVAASLDVPAHRFLKFNGEFHYGYSLGALLSISSETMRQRTISGWGQIKSLWFDWLETNVGYGIDTLNNSQVATNFVQRNQMGFLNVMFKPVKSFGIVPEYNYLRTTYKGSGASNANVFFLNCIYYF